MRQLWRYAAIVACTAIADAVYTLFVLSAARGWILAAALLSSALPFLNYVGMATFVDAQSPKEKLYVTIATSLGMLIGSIATLLVFAQ